MIIARPPAQRPPSFLTTMPQVLRNPSAASPAADVHAFGLLIWEVFHSKVRRGVVVERN